jgi:predicted esterase
LLKSLQGHQEQVWPLQVPFELKGSLRRPEHPTQVILLLHGLGERGRRIYRKLIQHLPADALVLAPDAPWPLPRQKEGRLELGHAWYFFDKYQQLYVVNQSLARQCLKQLLQQHNPTGLPLSIIGFSQGGYLAPLIGQDHPETRLVIGIGCEFRRNLIDFSPGFALEAVHGVQDTVIPPAMALEQIAALALAKIPCGWHPVEQAGHEITTGVAETVGSLLEQYGK